MKLRKYNQLKGGNCAIAASFNTCVFLAIVLGIIGIIVCFVLNFRRP